MSILKLLYLFSLLLALCLTSLTTINAISETNDVIHFQIDRRPFYLFSNNFQKSANPSIELADLSKFTVTVDAQGAQLEKCYSYIKTIEDRKFTVFNLVFNDVTSFSTDVYFVSDKSNFDTNVKNMIFYINCKINNKSYLQEFDLVIQNPLAGEFSFDNWSNLMKKESLSRSSFAIVPEIVPHLNGVDEITLSGRWVDQFSKKYLFLRSTVKIIPEYTYFYHIKPNVDAEVFIQVGNPTSHLTPLLLNSEKAVDNLILKLNRISSDLLIRFQFPPEFVYPFNSCSAYLQSKDNSHEKYVLFKCFFPFCYSPIDVYFVKELVDVDLFFSRAYIFHLACDVGKNPENINIDTLFKANIKFVKPDDLRLEQISMDFDTWKQIRRNPPNSASVYAILDQNLLKNKNIKQIADLKVGRTNTTHFVKNNYVKDPITSEMCIKMKKDK